jgi:hypothetical protein
MDPASPAFVFKLAWLEISGSGGLGTMMAAIVVLVFLLAPLCLPIRRKSERKKPRI